MYVTSLTLEVKMAKSLFDSVVKVANANKQNRRVLLPALLANVSGETLVRIASQSPKLIPALADFLTRSSNRVASEPISQNAAKRMYNRYKDTQKRKREPVRDFEDYVRVRRLKVRGINDESADERSKEEKSKDKADRQEKAKQKTNKVRKSQKKVEEAMKGAKNAVGWAKKNISRMESQIEEAKSQVPPEKPEKKLSKKEMKKYSEERQKKLDVIKSWEGSLEESRGDLAKAKKDLKAGKALMKRLKDIEEKSYEQQAGFSNKKERAEAAKAQAELEAFFKEQESSWYYGDSEEQRRRGPGPSGHIKNDME